METNTKVTVVECEKLYMAISLLRTALENIEKLKCRCGIAGSCGCGERAREIADDALDELKNIK